MLLNAGLILSVWGIVCLVAGLILEISVHKMRHGIFECKFSQIPMFIVGTGLLITLIDLTFEILKGN